MTKSKIQLSQHQFKSIFQGLEFKDDARPLTNAELLAGLEPRQRVFIEHWHGIARRSDVEVARLFLRRAPQALQLMDFDGIEAWLLRALEQFDQRGLGWAVDVLNNAEQFAAERERQQNSLVLAEVSDLLARLSTGLGGRELHIAAADCGYTDTETLYLPERLDKPDRDQSFALYKTMTVHHWAQTWHGTWRLPVVDGLLTCLEQERVWNRYAALERLRLDAIIARDLPGVYRLMRELGAEPILNGPWRAAAEALRQPGASVQTSLQYLDHVDDALPPAAQYHGVFNPRQVQLKQQARIQREREQLRLLAGKLQQQLESESDEDAGPGESPREPRQRKPSEGFTLSQGEPGQSGRIVFQLRIEEQDIDVPDSMRELLNSIYQDLGEIPEDYLQGIGRRFYDAEQAGAPSAFSYATGGLDGADTMLRLPEWDYTRQRFRSAYCILREYAINPGDPEFVAATRHKYYRLLKSIRRSFEVLLGGERVERRQPDGDDIDLDALVQARADACHGEEMSAAVYTRLRYNERSIAVMFMVDMSGSTKGWVNLAEREALVLLCEALETIGDRYAIYGFSGRTHQRVDVFRIKRFEERYSTLVKSRIAGIQPRAYTRLGAPIRYLGGLLKQESARHKLLITLSDGKPEDYGSYYGQYGVEDTRHALLELRRDGIHPFCITIDKEGGDYLPHMYGPSHYAVIDEVPKLPLKVADIYRKLTS